MAELAKMLMAGALSVTIVVVVLIIVCEIIDFTRRTRRRGERAKGRRREMSQGNTFPGQSKQPVSFDIIRKAKKRPKRCSPIRWKMELSRRRLERVLGALYNNLPDPDRLP